MSFIHIARADKEEGIPEYSTGHRCPNHPDLLAETGYGLAGGGMGVYTYCPDESCGKILSKSLDDKFEEGQFDNEKEKLNPPQ